MVVVGVSVAAAIGAIVRVVATNPDAGFNRQMIATGMINVLGSFLLGWLANSDASANTVAMVSVGGLGAFTTFSTYISQIECINRQGKTRDAVLYGGASLIAGIGAAYLGWQL